MGEQAKVKKTLPKGWREVRLSSVASVKTGPFGAQLHQHDYVESNGTPIVTVEHLSEIGLSHKNLPLVSAHDKKRLSKYLIKKGDIVFSRVGSVDRSTLVSENENGWLFSGRLLRVRPEEHGVYSPYLNYFFHTRKFRDHMRSIAVGGTMPSINTSILSGVTIRLPSMGRQKAIASLLEKWDTAIEKTESLIEAKERRFKWLLKRLISDQQGNPEWRQVGLGEVFDLSRGRVISKKEIGNNVGPFPVYSSQTFNNGELGRLSTYDFEGDYITWTTDGANAGAVFYRTGKFNCTNVCGVAKPITIDEVDCQFVSYFLQGKTRRYVSYVGNPKLMNNIFANIPIAFPSFSEQKRIALILSTAKKEIAVLEDLTEQYRTQKRGLMQKLLTGEWRVRK